MPVEPAESPPVFQMSAFDGEPGGGVTTSPSLEGVTARHRGRAPHPPVVLRAAVESSPASDQGSSTGVAPLRLVQDPQPVASPTHFHPTYVLSLSMEHDHGATSPAILDGANFPRVPSVSSRRAANPLRGDAPDARHAGDSSPSSGSKSHSRAAEDDVAASPNDGVEFKLDPAWDWALAEEPAIFGTPGHLRDDAPGGLTDPSADDAERIAVPLRETGRFLHRRYTDDRAEREFHRFMWRRSYLRFAIVFAALFVSFLLKALLNLDGITALYAVATAVGALSAGATACAAVVLEHRWRKAAADTKDGGGMVEYEKRHLRLVRLGALVALTLFATATFVVAFVSVDGCFVAPRTDFMSRPRACRLSVRFAIILASVLIPGISKEPMLAAAALSVGLAAGICVDLASGFAQRDMAAAAVQWGAIALCIATAVVIAWLRDRNLRSHFSSLVRHHALRRRQLDSRAQTASVLNALLPQAVALRVAASAQLTHEGAVCCWRSIAEYTHDAAPSAFVCVTEPVDFVAFERAHDARHAAVAGLAHLFALFDIGTQLFHVDRAATFGDAYIVTAGLVRLPRGASSRSRPRGCDASALAITRYALWQLSLDESDVLPLRSVVACGPVVGGVLGCTEFALRYHVGGEALRRALRVLRRVLGGEAWVDTEVHTCLRRARNRKPSQCIDARYVPVARRWYSVELGAVVSAVYPPPPPPPLASAEALPASPEDATIPVKPLTASEMGSRVAYNVELDALSRTIIREQLGHGPNVGQRGDSDDLDAFDLGRDAIAPASSSLMTSRPDAPQQHSAAAVDDAALAARFELTRFGTFVHGDVERAFAAEEPTRSRVIPAAVLLSMAVLSVGVTGVLTAEGLHPWFVPCHHHTPAAFYAPVVGALAALAAMLGLGLALSNHRHLELRVNAALSLVTAGLCAVAICSSPASYVRNEPICVVVVQVFAVTHFYLSRLAPWPLAAVAVVACVGVPASLVGGASQYTAFTFVTVSVLSVAMAYTSGMRARELYAAAMIAREHLALATAATAQLEALATGLIPAHAIREGLSEAAQERIRQRIMTLPEEIVRLDERPANHAAVAGPAVVAGVSPNGSTHQLQSAAQRVDDLEAEVDDRLDDLANVLRGDHSDVEVTALQDVCVARLRFHRCDPQRAPVEPLVAVWAAVEAALRDTNAALQASTSNDRTASVRVVAALNDTLVLAGPLDETATTAAKEAVAGALPGLVLRLREAAAAQQLSTSGALVLEEACGALLGRGAMRYGLHGVAIRHAMALAHAAALQLDGPALGPTPRSLVAVTPGYLSGMPDADLCTFQQLHAPWRTREVGHTRLFSLIR